MAQENPSYEQLVNEYQQAKQRYDSLLDQYGAFGKTYLPRVQSSSDPWTPEVLIAFAEAKKELNRTAKRLMEGAGRSEKL